MRVRDVRSGSAGTHTAFVMGVVGCSRPLDWRAIGPGHLRPMPGQRLSDVSPADSI